MSNKPLIAGVWVKASERLPDVWPDQSKPFYCRHIKDGDKKILWYGKSSQSLLASEPWNWEWLDESASAGEDELSPEQIKEIEEMAYSVIDSVKRDEKLMRDAASMIASSAMVADSKAYKRKAEKWLKEYDKMLQERKLPSPPQSTNTIK